MNTTPHELQPSETSGDAAAVESEAPRTPPAPAPRPRGLRRLLYLVLGIALAAGVLVWVVPKISLAMTTVSTDDAYTNSHVTFVAPRVVGQVAQVLVDDNDRVQKGQLLVQLDKEPYQVMVAIKKAALNSVIADRAATEASVRGLVGQTRGLRFNLLHAVEDADNQIALLRSRVATLEKAKASLTLAQSDFERAKQLSERKVISQAEFEQRQEGLRTAEAQVNQSQEDVYQARSALGLPAQPSNGDFTQVPPDLDQTFSSVRQAEAQLIQAAAQLGIVASSFDIKPKELIEEFLKRDPQGNIDRIYADVVKNAPAMKQAEAKEDAARRDLEEAELNLRYCDIVSEIEGIVSRRNVNPGNNVQPGQSLMAVRSLREIWVDANFKETQLSELRIGQPVDLLVDMYGPHAEFKGRISGFTIGTGSTLSLLPAQNATGNFIKVVQRLPVRIDVLDYDPDKQPLFIGLSVTPRVYTRARTTGPDAGKLLQPATAPAAPSAPAAKP